MKFYDFLKDHSAVVAAALVGGINLVGLFYNYAVFAAMGYSYTDFAAFEDFLVAAFKSPLALIYSLIFFAVAWRSVRKALQVIGESKSNLQRTFSMFLLVAIFSIGVAGAPAVVGWASVSTSKDDLFIFPATPEVVMTCKRTNADIKIYEGEMISEAGGMFLLKTKNDAGLLVAKSCVVSIAAEAG